MESKATKYINDFYIKNDQSLLVDPFNEPWKKILGTISYVFQVLGGLVLMSFIRYESQGNLAQFRTALNQLTSWIGVNVSIIMDNIKINVASGQPLDSLLGQPLGSLRVHSMATANLKKS